MSTTQELGDRFVGPHAQRAAIAAPGIKWRVVLSSYVGSVVEWFDFFIYSVATASVFNVLFFPNESAGVGTLLALATLAIGYLVRPIGGVIYGHFGDRIGRKKMLVSSIVLMGFSTVLVGIMPTYAQIGVAAPILLLTLRVIQGLAVAGEWGGALLMTLEHAGKGRRGVCSCVIGMGQCSGLLLGTFVFGLISRMPQDQFLCLGLARALHRRRPADRPRPLDAPRHRGKPGVPASSRRCRSRTRNRACRSSSCCAPARAKCCNAS